MDLNDNGLCDTGEPAVGPIELATPFDRQLAIATTPVALPAGG